MRLSWVLLLALRANAADLAVPQIDLVYQPGGSVFDRNCAAMTKGAIDQAQIDETARRLSEFQRRWDNDGPTYLKTALAAVGAPFPYRQMQATLTVCVNDMSSPLLISTKAHLSNSTKRDPDWYFAFVVYHEIMHHYGRAAFETSALRKKYAAESPVTLNHLHVVALELYTLEKLGKPQELDYLNNRYRNATTGHRRAWEIVNAEGKQAFIDEMKQTAKHP
jgi:hypothetical protein